MFSKDSKVLKKAWTHECTVSDPRRRSLPEVVPNQELRNLRNRAGYKDSKGLFAFCPHCDQTWTYEELLNKYVRAGVVVSPPVVNNVFGMFNNEEQIPKARMMAKIIEYQKAKSPAIAPTE